MGLLGNGCGPLGLTRHRWTEQVPIPGVPQPEQPTTGRRRRKRQRGLAPGTYTVRQLPACTRCGKPNPNYREGGGDGTA